MAPRLGWDSEDPAEPPPAKAHEHKCTGAAPREGPPTPHPLPGCGGTRHPFPNPARASLFPGALGQSPPSFLSPLLCPLPNNVDPVLAWSFAPRGARWALTVVP